ncbi:uncharacterized protein LOC119191408, partial [Manduca sexta]|uniref:uncharacterized protein LOC119191408 n=1 Tax=Manduca sexta TaxID=7130 RepID=UPI00188F9FEF
GRHKRNATFPGGQTASLLQSSTTRKYSADASTLRDVADGCGGTRTRYCSGGATTWPGPRVQPPQPEIPSLAAPAPIDTKGTLTIKLKFIIIIRSRMSTAEHVPSPKISRSIYWKRPESSDLLRLLLGYLSLVGGRPTLRLPVHDLHSRTFVHYRKSKLLCSKYVFCVHNDYNYT